MYVDDSRFTDGRVLASFQLIPAEEAASTPLPRLVPRTKARPLPRTAAPCPR
jgi:hypothetical protein